MAAAAFSLTLAQVAQWLTAVSSPGTFPPDLLVDGRVCSGFSIDSRTLKAGDLYIALRGEKHDGHHFVAQAMAQGAVAALVAESFVAPAGLPGPLLRTQDTLVALQELARRARLTWQGRVIGLTGSAGKTTTKDLVALVCSTLGSVAKTEGNLNNHIGLPLTILRSNPTSQCFVLEMGMNHGGEIRLLATIGRPEIAVITNVGTAHLEHFLSQEGIALAKRELVEALPPTGIAVLNGDDHRVARFRDLHLGRSVSYGFSPEADLRVEQWVEGEEGSTFLLDGQRYQLPLPGRHAVMNAAAAVATGLVLGAQPNQMAAALAQAKAGKMRGEKIRHNGVTLINDSYNSNVEAAKAMLQYLAAQPGQRRIALLGEMLELGPQAPALHRQVGEYAASLGIDVVWGIKGNAVELAEGARLAGAGDAAFFADAAAAGLALRQVAQPGDVVLLKGSRGTQVEIALERYLNG